VCAHFLIVIVLTSHRKLCELPGNCFVNTARASSSLREHISECQVGSGGKVGEGRSEFEEVRKEAFIFRWLSYAQNAPFSCSVLPFLTYFSFCSPKLGEATITNSFPGVGHCRPPVRVWDQRYVRMMNVFAFEVAVQSAVPDASLYPFFLPMVGNASFDYAALF